MKASDVLNTLNISRITLYRLVKRGEIKAERLPNGRLNYDEESVYNYLLKMHGKPPHRKTIIYARVSTNKQKKDLDNQVELLKQFCISNGWKIEGIYSDINSALDFDNRKQFWKLFEMVQNHEVERVVVSHKDRLTRIGWNFFESLFKKYGVEIIVVNDYNNDKTDVDEILEEIITLLHSFPMKFYSKRRLIKSNIKEWIK
ncbi:IS607 family transposase [Methanothermococcus sp.]|uniref:IS607 family transposase n=1 Tax=Methanothermococcus sp. TaxID=2614238 RepID=UPI0025E8F1AE|nr:IS607 family transposase [Methanothermococcus sp.]